MSRTLVAHEQPLHKIFSDDFVFTIPGYQRPYSWATEQAGELFDDLYGFMRNTDKTLEEIPPYFLGSIVLIKEDAIPATTVVDGQQRLTTITLLLSAIRSQISDAKAQQGISRLIYEQGDIIVNTGNHYRLTLRDRDMDFFRTHVQHDGGIEQLIALNDKLPDSQHNLRENAKLFVERLAKISVDDRLRLAQFVATRCFLVTVCTPDLDSAYRIFNVLNSRGLDLTATDILKAEIIGKIPTNRRDELTTVWEDIEDDLGREDFNNLFSHIRMIYRKAKPQGTLLKEFREHVTYASSEAFIETMLKPLAKAYEEITDASFASQCDAEAINTHLYWLNRIEFKDWMPPALAFISQYRNDPKTILTFLRDLERLVYSMLIRRWGINDRVERCSSLTAAIENNKNLWDTDSPLLLKPVEKWNTYSALNGPIYDTHSARALSVLLLRLDSLVSGGGASYSFDIVTVEHVLPQNPRPDSTWITWFPDLIQRMKAVHRLGNLALLTRKKNSSANNYDFDRKKVAYFAKGGVSPFALTTQVLQHQVWSANVIDDRQAELLAKLEEHFGLQGRKDPSAAILEELGG